MKQYERLETLATQKESEAAAIRATLAMLMSSDNRASAKFIGGKVKAAIAIRADANGNGNGNGNGHANGNGSGPTTKERVITYLGTQPKQHARISDVSDALGITYSAVASICDRVPKEVRRIGRGVIGLPGSVKKRVVSAANRKRMAQATKARWAAAKKAGKTLGGKPLQTA